MKLKFALFILMSILCLTQAKAGDQVDVLSDFMKSVRMETGISTCSQLPDSVLIDLSQRAINYVSNDVGGVEAKYPVVTVAWQCFYAIPDSIVEVLYATLIVGKTTLPMVKWPPQYSDKIGITELEESASGDDNTDLTPIAYNIWNDSIQLMPIPTRDDDTVYLKCFIEHPVVDTVTDSIKLEGKFLEAAIDYTCHLVYRRTQQFETSALYKNIYDAIVASIRQRIAAQGMEYMKAAE